MRRNQVAITCDRCGKQEIFAGGYSSTITFASIKIEYELQASRYNERKNYELCPDCLAKLGIVNEDKKVIESQDTNEPSVAEKLYNVICEIVSDNIEQ